MSSTSEYRPDIDGLRAVAVSVVLLYHLGFAAVPGGFVGVDVFFVISGFLITSIIYRQMLAGKFTFADFYARRAKRILPALVVMLVGVIAAGWWLLAPSDYDGVGKATLASLGFSSNMYFWQVGGYFDADVKLSPLLHTWSLGVEEQFYLGLPLLMIALLRLGRTALESAVLIIAALTLAASLVLLQRYRDPVFYFSPFRAWELLAGSAIALWPMPSIRSRLLREGLSLTALAGILAPSLLYSKATWFPGLAAAPPVLGAAVLIAIGPSGPSFVRTLLSSRAFVAIGLISYSLYLWHWPIVVFAKFALPWEADGGAIGAGLLVASIIAAALSHRWVETPFRMTPLPRWQLAVGVPTTLGTAAAAVAVVVTLGQPDRLDPRIVEIDQERIPLVPWQACDHRRPIDPADRTCVMGASQADDVRYLIWGDSHALAWGPAFDDAMKQLGEAAIFIPGSACPPLFGVSNVVKPRCQRRRAEVEAFLASSTTIHTVVLSASWTPYFTTLGGYVLEDSEGRDGNAAVASRGLERTTKALRQRGIRAIVIGPVPGARGDVQLARLFHAMYGKPLPPPVDVQDTRKLHAEFFAAAERAGGAGDATVIDVLPWFCGERDCPYMVRGHSLYRDSDHLSVRGARLFSGQMAASLASPKQVEILTSGGRLP